jgi:hypothetical protein
MTLLVIAETLENIEKNKIRIARWYDKRVKIKVFAKGDLV